MDFSYLLELAKANEEKTKSDKSARFSTKVSNAKKIAKPGPKPEAINELLSKIKVDKEKEKEKFIKQRDELLALREKDRHSKKRVHSLINRTKGASKSVLEDAKDITTAKGETQCDEDDYGYESAISQKIFSSLQNKYHELPEDERLKFEKTKKSSIEDIKNRVMSSLKQEQEEGLGLRKRKRNRKSHRNDGEDDGFINDGDEYKKFNGEKRKKAEDAEENSKTSKNEESSKKLKKSSKYDIDPSLIHSKVDKYAKFKYDKVEKVKHQESQSGKKISKGSPACAMSFEELMKVAQKKQKDPIPIINPLKEILEKKDKPKVDESRPLTAKEKKEIEEERLRKLRKMGKLPPPKEDLSKLENRKKDPISTNSKSDHQPPKKAAAKEEKIVPEAPKKNLDKTRFFASPKPNVNNNTSKDVKVAAPAEKKTERFSDPYDKNKSSKGTLLKDTKKINSSKPVMKPKPPPQSYKRIDSDESEEYDSEMDDFIDDGDAGLDYSNEIAKLFKYDKSKYADDDDDDLDCMEASYSQMQKEEKISAKLGLMEDLEDIRREEEEKKRKKMLKKKK